MMVPFTQRTVFLWAHHNCWGGTGGQMCVRQVKACPEMDTCSPLSSCLLSQPGDQCDLSGVTHSLSAVRVELRVGGGGGQGMGGEVGGGRGTHFAVEFHRADCNFASSLERRWGVMVTNRATPEEAGSVLQVAAQSRGQMWQIVCADICRWQVSANTPHML